VFCNGLRSASRLVKLHPNENHYTEFKIHPPVARTPRLPAPSLTAEVLLSYALRRERSYLYAHTEEPLSEVAWLHTVDICTNESGHRSDRRRYES
jgi:hypothetical protein